MLHRFRLATRVAFSVVTFIFICVTTKTGAQQAPQSTDTPQYVYEVRGSSTSAPTQDRAWSQFYDTEAAALAELKKIEKEYAKGGILEFDNNKPTGLRVEKFAKSVVEFARKVKEAKDAVDKAKKLVDEGLTAEERKLGDTLKEYAGQIEDAYRRAVQAKKNLTSTTGTIARNKFDEANRLIEGYNQTRADFSRASQEAAGSPLMPRFTSTLTQYPELARVSPQDLKGKLGADAPSGKFTVWVYKQEGGQWVKQEERTLKTDDEKIARKYVANVKSVSGWTATSNLQDEDKKESVGQKNLLGTKWVDVMNRNYVLVFKKTDGINWISGYKKDDQVTTEQLGYENWVQQGQNVTFFTLNGGKFEGKIINNKILGRIIYDDGSSSDHVFESID